MTLVARVRCGNCGRVAGRIERDGGPLDPLVCTIAVRMAKHYYTDPTEKITTRVEQHRLLDPRVVPSLREVREAGYRWTAEWAAATLPPGSPTKTVNSVTGACGCKTLLWLTEQQLRDAVVEHEHTGRVQTISATSKKLDHIPVDD